MVSGPASTSGAPDFPARRSVPIRALLAVLVLGTAAYVGLFSALVVFQIAPAIGTMKLQSHTGMATWTTRIDLDSSLQWAAGQLDALAVRQLGGETIGGDAIQPIVDSLGRYSQSPWVAKTTPALARSPLETRTVLARAMAAESGAIDALLESAAALELKQTPSAIRQLHRADSLRAAASFHLLGIERAALMAAFEGERNVGKIAESAVEMVWWWAGAGLLLGAWFVLVVHRRLYVPLARLEAGLNQVSAGDLSVHITVLREDEIGRLTRHLNRATAVLRDRTEGERRAALERAAREWSMTFDAIPDPVMVVDIEGKLLRLNEAARAASGRPHTAVLGRSLVEVGVDPLWRRADAVARDVRAAGQRTSTQVRSVRHRRTWDIEGMPVFKDGDIQAIIIVAHDITALSHLQDSLRKAETMAAMGSLVAGVAHEVRNPLFSMTATLDAFEARHRDRARDEPHLEILRSQLGRLQQLMRDLLEYGKPQSLELTDLQLPDVVGLAADATASVAQEGGVSVRCAANSDLPGIQGDRNRLVQVFSNLILNAIQHSPRGGEVVVGIQALQQDDRYWLEATVEDQGPGFAADALPHVFEPFYTRRRGGTGLGLALVFRILEQHGGTVSAGNGLAGGGLLRIRFPLSRS